MDEIAAALGDRARWRIVELLAARPRSVGELAELSGLRQPQTTKHLQTLARAGLVTVTPLGQRRVYAVESGPLAALERRLHELVEAAELQQDERDVIARYRTAIDAESARADRERWADGRTFTFERLLDAPREVVWQHWIDPELLAGWWVPPSMTVLECGVEPEPGGRVVLEYRDAEGRYRSEGTVRVITQSEQLGFELSVLDAAGSISFTGHFELTLVDAEGSTRLRLDLRITETTVEAMPSIAGIETGWGQVLDNLASSVQQASKPARQQASTTASQHDSKPARQQASTSESSRTAILTRCRDHGSSTAWRGSTIMTNPTSRKVTANLSLTLDGRYNGPGGPADLGAIVPYATTDVARDHLSRIWQGATTALLGRGNAEGFLGFWPSVAADQSADPRDRGYASWLVGVEKVVLSTTLTEAPWERTRVMSAPVEDVVAELKASGDGDILVNSSASIIKALLAADLLDRLYLMVCPEIAGGGERLFDDGLPSSKWTLAQQQTGELGEMALVYDRAR